VKNRIGLTANWSEVI